MHLYKRVSLSVSWSFCHIFVLPFPKLEEWGWIMASYTYNDSSNHEDASLALWPLFLLISKGQWIIYTRISSLFSLCNSKVIVLLTPKKKNGTLWKKVDSLWLDQSKFIPSTSLISLLFCMTLPHLHDRLHHPRHWFIQLVEVVKHYASPNLFVDG